MGTSDLPGPVSWWVPKENQDSSLLSPLMQDRGMELLAAAATS